MTKQQFLDGFGSTPAERERAMEAYEWRKYATSPEAREEREVLAELAGDDDTNAPGLTLV